MGDGNHSLKTAANISDQEIDGYFLSAVLRTLVL